MSDSLDKWRKQLRKLAVVTFMEGVSSFKEDEIEPLKDCFDLAEIEVTSGLLVKQGWKTYSFLHQTFQEYLVAEEFLDSPQNQKKIFFHIAESRWQEVFFLVLEMLSCSESFLISIKNNFYRLRTEYTDLYNEIEVGDEEAEKAKRLEYKDLYGNLQDFLIQVNEKLSSIDVSYKPAALRTIYFGYWVGLSEIHDSMRGEFLGWGCLHYRFDPDNIFNLARMLNVSLIEDSCISNQVEVDHHLITIFSIAAEIVNYGVQSIDITEPNSIHDLTCDLSRKLLCLTSSSPAFLGGNNLNDEDDDFEQLSLFSNEKIERKEKIVKAPFKALIDLPYEFLDSIQSLYEQISPHIESDDLEEWWTNDGGDWIDALKELIIRWRNVGSKKFLSLDNLYYRYEVSDDMYEFLGAYFEANSLIIECLYNNPDVADEVISLIKENLFLP